jgi:hypothetical protein
MKAMLNSTITEVLGLRHQLRAFKEHGLVDFTVALNILDFYLLNQSNVEFRAY